MDEKSLGRDGVDNNSRNFTHLGQAGSNRFFFSAGHKFLMSLALLEQMVKLLFSWSLSTQAHYSIS